MKHPVHRRNERRKHGQNDQSLNLLQCSLRSHLAEMINEIYICCRHSQRLSVSQIVFAAGALPWTPQVCCPFSKNPTLFLRLWPQFLALWSAVLCSSKYFFSFESPAQMKISHYEHNTVWLINWLTVKQVEKLLPWCWKSFFPGSSWWKYESPVDVE